ncbi:MAG: Fic family protein [Acidimicrobiia bacterium]|nr:Fic family protein [Acidimicrobiia bacterium]
MVAHWWPGGVLCGHSARTGGLPDDVGQLFIAHPDPARLAPLSLPGITATVHVGPGALPGDIALPSVPLFLAGPARTLVENFDLRGKRPTWRLGTVAVEDRIDHEARYGGAGRVHSLLHQLDVIAVSFDLDAVEGVRRRLAAVLGSFTGDSKPRSERLRARLAGTPFDQGRVEMFAELASALRSRAPTPVLVGTDPNRFDWLPFFEAYFSNYIEGTEFGVEEARRIVVDGEVPPDRPADAHDIAATHRLVADVDESRRVPDSSAEFVEMLRYRHQVLMAVRPDKQPGMFKDRPNFAGGYRFVDPELVEETLVRGFGLLQEVLDPFARSVLMMAVITECHPFDDGNGRIARIFANAELSAAGMVRQVIPTIQRPHYLAGLTAVSTRNGNGQALAAVLEHAQRWTAAVDWSTFDAAHETMDRTNAYADPATADALGRRLGWPDAPDS